MNILLSDHKGGGGWSNIPNFLNTWFMDDPSDHACEVITYVHDNVWETGILVAGGYRSTGAWTNSVEFFNFEKG